MLVTFSCPTHADITMFGDVATRLIRMMGHSGTVPSAILAANVPAALSHLQTALATTGEEPNNQESKDADDEEVVVSLQHRALPLLDLLAAASAAKCNVMWNRG